MKKKLILSPVAILVLAVMPLLGAFSGPLSQPLVSGPEIPSEVDALLSKYGCTACHAMSRKLVGPMWTDVAAKKYTKKQIMAFVYKPVPANWPGYPPMLAQTTVPKADLNKIATWLVAVK